MFVTDPMRLASALHWLGSDVNLGPMQLLAVVLDPSFRSLHRLQTERDRIDALSEHALVLVMGERWSDAGDLARRPVRDSAVQDWIPGFYGSLRTPIWEGARALQREPDVSPLDLILELLDLDASALPGVFLRAHGELPVWVSLPDEDTLVYLLEVVSRGARGPQRGASSLAGILDAVGLTGMAFAPDTVAAWDTVLTGHGATGRAARAHADWREPELARVASVWRRASTGHTTRLDDAAYDRLVRHRALLRKLTPFLRDDHLRTLNTAAHAHATEDWGTVVVNISRVIEGSVARALFAAARIRLGVRTPDFVQWWDPTLGPVPARGEHDFNAPRGSPVGPMTDAPRVPWRPPNLNPGLTTLTATPDIDARPSASSRELIDSIARCAVALRNPPAHGDPVDQDTALAAWELLEAWATSGCARALHELARSLCEHGAVDKVAHEALLDLDDAIITPREARRIASRHILVKLASLKRLQGQLTALRTQVADMLANGFTSTTVASLKARLAEARPEFDRRVFPRFPTWPDVANRLDAILGPREHLAERFSRAFPHAGLLDGAWLRAVSDAEVDRDGLLHALAFVQNRIATGAPAVPGQRSDRNFAADIAHSLKARANPLARLALDGAWLRQLDDELAGIEADVSDALQRQGEAARSTLHR